VRVSLPLSHAQHPIEDATDFLTSLRPFEGLPCGGCRASPSILRCGGWEHIEHEPVVSEAELMESLCRSWLSMLVVPEADFQEDAGRMLFCAASRPLPTGHGRGLRDGVSVRPSWFVAMPCRLMDLSQQPAGDQVFEFTSQP